MNKSILLSMAAMMSVNAEAEQKSSRFQKCTAHVRNHKKTYGTIGATAIIAGCIAIGLSFKSTDMPGDTSTDATRKALVKQINAAMPNNDAMPDGSNAIITCTTDHEGLAFYHLTNVSVSSDDEHIIVNGISEILQSNPSAVMLIRENYLTDALLEQAGLSHEPIMSSDHLTWYLVLNTAYWYRHDAGTTSHLRIFHLCNHKFKHSRILIFIHQELYSSKDLEIVIKQSYEAYIEYKKTCKEAGYKSAKFIYTIDSINVLAGNKVLNTKKTEVDKITIAYQTRRVKTSISQISIEYAYPLYLNIIKLLFYIL